MKLIIDIPEEAYNRLLTEQHLPNRLDIEWCIVHGAPIPDNATNGKEVLLKYCLEHSGEEIYDLLKQIHDASMSWTDSRGFIIEWLERGAE